jgi:CHAT domain-containing protein
MLSACETALTDPGRRADAFVGLTQAFLDAGAASVTASLWPVVNDLTADFASRYYAHHLGNGLTVPHALRAAAMDMRSCGAPASCWAAFTAYANP